MPETTIEQIEAEIARRGRYRKFLLYKPYPTQYEFHKASLNYTQRAMLAGNQTGKTYAASMEVAYHLTGVYPDWWPGIRYNRPVLVWTGSESAESSKEVIQHALYGTELADKNHPDFGSGSIPRESIIDVSRRQSSVKDVIESSRIRHISGGESRVVHKAYKQGQGDAQTSWAGKKVDIIWPDEEIPVRVFREAQVRTNAADPPGGQLLLTFTPLAGTSEVVNLFMAPEPGALPRFFCHMSIDEVEHYTDEQKKEILSKYLPHEREARAHGIPLLGEGRVFPVKESSIRARPFSMRRHKHLHHIIGLDFGIDHPTAAVWMAFDFEGEGRAIVYDIYRESDLKASIHRDAIASRYGHWIPVAWPHDGTVRDKGSGIQLKDTYWNYGRGINMLPFSARYDDDKGGGQPVEPVIAEVLEWMSEGRFHVFEHLHKWFEEFRSLHRKNGKVIALHDDIMKATFYAFMMRRYATTELIARRGDRMHAPLDMPVAS